MSAPALAEQASLCGGRGSRGKILDVGCSSGVFLAHMRSLGWDVCGVEISREAAEWAGRELGLGVINKPLTSAGLPRDHFDVVTFWSSLEHMHDPMSYLREAYRILKPGGRVIILVPNFASPTVRWLHWGLDPPRHLYHFTPRTITRALREAGFSGRMKFRGTSKVEEGSFHRQVAKLGRRLRRSFQRNGGPVSRPVGATAGWAIARWSVLLAPVSWALASAHRSGPMTIITCKGRTHGAAPATRSALQRAPAHDPEEP